MIIIIIADVINSGSGNSSILPLLHSENSNSSDKMITRFILCDLIAHTFKSLF